MVGNHVCGTRVRRDIHGGARAAPATQANARRGGYEQLTPPADAADPTDPESQP
jgi:hypothetical protein